MVLKTKIGIILSILTVWSEITFDVVLLIKKVQLKLGMVIV